MTHAQSRFSSPGVLRLGIPENWMSDGPHDVREELLWDQWNIAKWTNDSCIAFPALTCLAATWNPELSYIYGKQYWKKHATAIRMSYWGRELISIVAR